MLRLDRKLLIFLGVVLLTYGVRCEDTEALDSAGTADPELAAHLDASKTDDEVLQREEEAIKIDGLNVAQLKNLREQSEKHVFQAEVNRMMKLIINSLYRNKEIFLRELISNASDALDKIRLLALTDKEQLSSTDELSIRIKLDKENHILHITDTGIGMTKNDLIKNLGTIAKSGTSEFFNKMQDSENGESASDLIGQFGVGFYSAFLVADTVVVTSKHNDDKQYIWESNSNEFSIVEDPRGDTLKRGTQISLHLKEEAFDFVEHDTVKTLIKKYSQFINFPIYLWESSTEEVEEPIEEEEEEVVEDKDEDKVEEEGAVEEEEEKDDKPKTKKVSKTTWDWVLINDSKPIWMRKPAEIEDAEYQEFYKSMSKDSKDALAHTHFVAEGEVTFKALLFVPSVQNTENFNKYGTRTENVKLYVRRVFITDDFQDIMPNYLSFIRGVVDSDDLPLNVSREMLQQHKLLKVIKKKLVRKVLDMIKKMSEEAFISFWKEYSTNIKLGVIEDSSNRNRLAKILRFESSSLEEGKKTSLMEYMEKMKSGQQHIYYMAGGSRAEVVSSPFVERLLKKGYEVLYLTEAIDEYTINALPEFEGKKFQNVAKEGFALDEGEAAKEHTEELKKKFEPLTKWLAEEESLKAHIDKAEVSERLSSSPCALVASKYGWSANMERIVMSQTHSKAQDAQREYYLGQKKTLEVNPRHPLIKELLRRIDSDPQDAKAKDIATMMFRTATLRSGYLLKDTVEFAQSVEEMMRKNLGVSLDEEVEEEPQLPEDDHKEDEADETEEVDAEDPTMHEEL